MARRNQACAAGGALIAFTWLAAPPHSPQSQIGSCVEVAPACEGGLAQLADPQRRAAQRLRRGRKKSGARVLVYGGSFVRSL